MISDALRRQIEGTLTSPVFRQAAESLAVDFYLAWQSTAPDQTVEREDLYQRQRVLVDVVQKLQDLVISGDA